jgi:plastocyanin
MKSKTGVITKLALAALLIFAALLLSGCSEDKAAIANNGPQLTTDHTIDQPNKGEVQISIENFVFVPAEVTISPGTKVTWINKDEAPHTATSLDKKFNSGGMDTDDKFSFVFNEKGEYPYFCALHPHMKANITVK